ncbi:MAG: Maf family nucleotide pyrophosphatase [Urechidicola sp.]|nr:Maf family nucleotide pyrophosphatase [Urechidicola sp.]
MLNEHLKNRTIILASGSPRRQQLLKELDLNFTIAIKEVEEIYPPQLKANEITEFLAELKASPFQNLNDNDILITSDTIVWLEDKAIGKPKDLKDAMSILKTLSGKEHQVITSVCLKSKNHIKVFSDITHVSFKSLDIDEIDYYSNKYKPLDKAGAYGIQDWIGLIGVKKIEGSYFNVMGLPVHKLYAELLKF